MNDRPAPPNGKTQADESMVYCPQCHNREAYRLADGRYKCKQCKKKYSAKRLRAKVSPTTLAAITDSFWAMKTAEQCSQELRINRKTAQNYYSRLRAATYDENNRFFCRIKKKLRAESTQTTTNKYPVFWSLAQNNRICIIFPEIQGLTLLREAWPDAQGISEVFTKSPAARKNIVLDKFYRRTLWVRKKTDERILQEFWRQAKTNLVKYRGGSKSSFPHFMTEMAFRFNYRESEGALRLLHDKINGSPSETLTGTSGGSENEI